MSNIVRRRKYLIEFDVWEPHEKQVDVEFDKVIAFTKNTLSHAGEVKISRVAEERTDAETR